MKTRIGYVSNSSSSSFVLAYDKQFYGDLQKFFSENQIGFDTMVCTDDETEEFIYNMTSDERFKEIKKQINELKSNGMSILCGRIDNDCVQILSLLKYIGKTTGNNGLKMIIDPEEYY